MIIFWGFLAYLLILMGIGVLVNRLLLPVFGRGWRLFVAPGVIAHELTHALMCVVTGAPVMDINFWKSSGGHVLHGPPRIHIIGPVLISFAPLLLMTLAMFMFVPILSPALADLPWVQVVPTSLSQLLSGYLTSLAEAVTSFDWTSPTPWLLSYAMLNVAVTIAPSTVDLTNVRWAFVAFVLIAATLARLIAIPISVAVLWPPAATSLILLGMTLVAALLIRAVFQVIRVKIV
ncbi:MAG: hypothetical protein AAB647_03330 [Patescibacteria group bacterium]